MIKDFTERLLELVPLLKSYAENLTKKPVEAQDLLQETLLKALSNEYKFNSDYNLEAWLFTIMKNTFFNSRKIQKRSVFYEDSAHTVFNVKFSDSPDKEYYVKEIIEKVDALPDKYRAIFYKYLNGFKYEEIAEDLGLKLGTVKSKIFYAKGILTKKISRN